MLGLRMAICYIASLLKHYLAVVMTMNKSKAALFVVALFLSVFAFAERVPVRDGYGPIVGYNQKDLIRPMKWDSDTQILVSNHVYRDGTVGLGQFDLNEDAGRFGCKLIKKTEGLQTFFVYLDRPYGSRSNDWSLYILYPENYKCSPSLHSVEVVLNDKIKDVKKWNDYAESDEAKENARLFQLEQENKLNPKVEFGGFVATREDILTSVLLACYTGSLDSGGWPSISTQERTSRYKALLSLHDDSPASMQRITNAYNFALKNLSDRYPLDTMAKYRGSVCDQMVMKGKL